jgi:small subunit ribosomal protein S16
MAVTIRLSRAGKPGRAFFHIVVADQRFPRDGRCIEKLGYYDPVPNPAIIELKSDRALHWLEKGARPSATVGQLLKKKGIALVRKTVEKKPAKSEAAEKKPAKKQE